MPEAQRVRQPDVVAAELRREWIDLGWSPGRDIFTLFSEHVERDPDVVAVVDDDGEMTYGELHRASCRFARVLIDAGVEAGDVLAVQLPNRRIECVAELGAAAAGAIVIAYPLLYRQREVRSLVGRSRAVACIVPAEAAGFRYPAMLDEIAADLPDLRHRFVVGGEAPGFVAVDPLIAEDSAVPATRPSLDIPSDALVRILVTSGTEGEPKMSAFSHDATAGGLGNYMLATGGAPGRRIYMMPALSSGAGGLMAHVWIARVGGTVITTDAFSPEHALDVIRTRRPQEVFGVPTMFRMLTSLPPESRAGLDSVEVVDVSGSASPPELVRDTIEMFDCVYVNHYGCTDGVMTYTQLDDPLDKVMYSVGRPDPKVSTIRIVDEAGNDVEQGQPGEIWGRGPQSANGYFNDDELNARYRTHDGWTRTGDVGYIDEDGYLHVVDRVKDIIIRGGYNISPAEVEAEVLTYPGIAFAACVGIDDERLGERVCVVLQLAPGAAAPTVDELSAHLLARGLAKIKLPERIEVVDEMPVTHSGKIRRRFLREQVNTA